MAVKTSKDEFLSCERNWVYLSLIAVAGFWGAYTYLLRGNVFCNAQTGNVVLLGLAIGNGRWSNALYYLIPISAYIFGSFISEILPKPLKRCLHIRWDTILIFIEMVVVLIIGFIPLHAPVQIAQVMINFIASMQYNTFRQAEGVPMATTFATNHIRQIGVNLAKICHHRNRQQQEKEKLWKHAMMLLCFLAGVILGTICCNLWQEKAIWVSLLPLLVILLKLLYADLKVEKNLLDVKPAGH
ncbi:MAG: DUF1275 domain-containing protein [Erysipelotrichaceae bacterium]|nr:DUF1275 domain-containing protein [Erysipelotrichaceae bacterium]